MPTSKELKDLDSQLKKTVISAESFKRGSSLDSSKSIANIHKTIGNLAGHTRNLAIRFINLEKVVENNSKKITSLKNLSQSQGKRISGENIGAKLPGGTTSNVEDSISAIAKSVNSIAEILAGRKKLADDTAAYEKRKSEQEKRGLAESKLEKIFKGIAKTAEKVIAPVKSLLDRILDFIGTVILGRIVFKIIEWMGDPKNQSKVKSIIRFFSDWGPTLLSLYIVFGTSFGKFARGLISLVIKSTVRLGAAVAGLAVKAGIGKAGGKLSKVAGFLGGRKGKLLAAGLETAVTVGGTMALSNTLKGDGGSQQKAQGLAGGGYVRPRFPAFSGGGFNFKGMMGGAGMGAMFGPLGMLLGGSMGGSSGFVSGEKGVDKVPAMLSDGEFVMSRGAVAKYGVDTLEAMNAAGGGTNQPKIVSGIPHAYGGGLFGKDPGEGRNLSNGYVSIDQLNNLFKNIGFGNNFDISNPSTWVGGFKMPGMPSGGGFGMPNIGGIKIPSQFGGGTIGDLGKQASKIGESANGIQKYIQDTFNKVKSDPRVQNVGKAVNEIQKKLIKNGYLNEEGKLSGAAKNQATNFLSDLLPNLPFVNDMNKMKTESYLKSIGISKENAKYGDLAAQAMITGKSGIESAYNIGQMQLNKMSKESKKIYLDTLKERMASGTLKSGDVINPYGKVDKSDPRYREQGSVRFYVDPKTGKGYLLDTYGFDPGKVDLGGPGSAAQKQYENQVKSFQDPNKKIKLGPLDIPIGKIAKKLDLRPMQDATEGGGLPQYILALRNKMFNYDAQKEGAKLDPKRFKSKAQIDELSELGNLKNLAAKQLTPEQKKIIDAKSQAKVVKSKPKTLPVKPPVKSTTVMQGQTGVTMYSKNDPRRKSAKTSTPRFGATCPKGGNQKKKILGIF